MLLQACHSKHLFGVRKRTGLCGVAFPPQRVYSHGGAEKPRALRAAQGESFPLVYHLAVENWHTLGAVAIAMRDKVREPAGNYIITGLNRKRYKKRFRNNPAPAHMPARHVIESRNWITRPSPFVVISQPPMFYLTVNTVCRGLDTTLYFCCASKQPHVL